MERDNNEKNNTYLKLHEDTSTERSIKNPEFIEINSNSMQKDSNLNLNMKDNSLNYGGEENENRRNDIDEFFDKDNQDVVTIRNIHKTYLIGVEGVSALRGVTLQVKKGEFLVILGTSGGGKTTLLNVIGTIDTPSRGDLKIFDTLIRSNTGDDILSSIRLDQIAFVFQSFNLLPTLNVVENVEIPMKIKGELSSDEIRKRALDLLEKVGLKNRINHFPNQLSGGEQQRVTIARALSNKPKILLLDEPTGDLDTKNSDVVMNILVDLNIKENITMIMVTHDVGLKTFANRVVRVLDGKINSTYNIPDKIREETISKLKERIESKSIGLREGASNGYQNGDAPTSKTFVRKVSDYKIKKLSNV